MRNQKGITLIALVITIIVLLILAGVTISLTVGRNGALQRAREAVSANDLGNATEELNIAAADAQMGFMDAWTTNQHADSVNYYSALGTGVPNVYAANCLKAVSVAVYVPKDGTGAPVKDDDGTRHVYIRYLSSSATYYYFDMSITKDDSFKLATGISEDDDNAANTAAKNTLTAASNDYKYVKGDATTDAKARKDNAASSAAPAPDPAGA